MRSLTASATFHCWRVQFLPELVDEASDCRKWPFCHELGTFEQEGLQNFPTSGFPYLAPLNSWLRGEWHGSERVGHLRCFMDISVISCDPAVNFWRFPLLARTVP